MNELLQKVAEALEHNPERIVVKVDHKLNLLDAAEGVDELLTARGFVWNNVGINGNVLTVYGVARKAA